MRVEMHGDPITVIIAATSPAADSQLSWGALILGEFGRSQATGFILDAAKWTLLGVLVGVIGNYEGTGPAGAIRIRVQSAAQRRFERETSASASARFGPVAGREEGGERIEELGRRRDLLCHPGEFEDYSRESR